MRLALFRGPAQFSVACSTVKCWKWWKSWVMIASLESLLLLKCILEKPNLVLACVLSFLATTTFDWVGRCGVLMALGTNSQKPLIDCVIAVCDYFSSSLIGKAAFVVPALRLLTLRLLTLRLLTLRLWTLRLWTLRLLTLRLLTLRLLASSITTPQDAHKRLVLQVYLGSNTLEFSAIRR